MALVRDDYSNAEAFLAARPAVRSIDLLLPDLCGVLRGKRVDLADLHAVYERGMYLPGSMFALDVLGGTIHPPDSDSRGRCGRPACPCRAASSPRPGSGRASPSCRGRCWPRRRRVLWRSPHVLDTGTRALCRARLATVVAIELEFYFVIRRRNAGGHAQPPRSRLTGRRETARRSTRCGPRFGLRHPDGESRRLRRAGTRPAPRLRNTARTSGRSNLTPRRDGVLPATRPSASSVR